jgi:dienelactone hydrolase
LTSHPTSRRRVRVAGALAAALILSAGCLNHYLIYPEQDPAGVATWSADVTRGPLLVHLEWAQPPGSGPFPTVIVHPEGGKVAADMKGVTRDLARRGYLAVAVDYQRLIDGEFRRNTFAWREPSDPVAALELVRAEPGVDRGRIAALGFSQGGIYSLLMAAYSPDVKAVVVSKEGAKITAEELWAFCDEHMPRFWVPRYIEFRQEMPKTPSQKIQKYLLRHDGSVGVIFDREKPSRSSEA